MNISAYGTRYKHSLIELMKHSEIPESRAEEIIRRYHQHPSRTLLLAYEGKNLLGYSVVAQHSSHNIGEMVLGDILLTHAHIVSIGSVFEDRGGVFTGLIHASKSWAQSKDKQGLWLCCDHDDRQLFFDNGFYEDTEYHPNGWSDDPDTRLYFLVSGPRTFK